MHNANKLKIGLFGMNCSSALAMTTAEERWQAGWEENLEIARAADACGLDFLLPVGRWKGYGGETDFEGSAFETLTWASALLDATKQITIFGTVHTALFHPIIAAKQMVTADRVGHGRFGLNIVAGWNAGEFEMFGIEQRDHHARYEHAQEWIDAVRMMWEETAEVDFEGKYFHFKGLRAKPKPYGGSRPVIMNAGRSQDGVAFALRNCDAFFTGLRTMAFDETSAKIEPNIDEAAAVVDSARRTAADLGRELGVYTRSEIICRPTQREAVEYYHYAYHERADWSAVEYELRIAGLTPESPEWRQLRKLRIRRFPIVGDPETVAVMLERIARAGFDGMAISMVNFTEELPLFRDEVLPRLARAGLRGSL
jgi:alkanesulfonate monooxygenase SsuD/methylene tetrahydromethanopterin reductase-like flavin-dependent oxidoreductase (luciferase family)